MPKAKNLIRYESWVRAGRPFAFAFGSAGVLMLDPFMPHRLPVPR